MQPEGQKDLVSAVVRLSKYCCVIAVAVALCLTLLIITLISNGHSGTATISTAQKSNDEPLTVVVQGVSSSSNPKDVPAITGNTWKSPDENTIPVGDAGAMIRYGKLLVLNTATYFGPQGSIAHITNGMNCQNCHLAGGTKIFGNNYASFIAGYPKMSGRSGKVEPASARIVECFERSLAGKSPDTSKREIQSILAYMKWIGKDVKKGQKVFGSATEKVPFLNNAADPAKGKLVYTMKCQSCHGQNGEGLLTLDKRSYTNPPLWGKNSYNDGAGMYRVTNLAGFVKDNMPFGTTYQNPQLTDEEAWDVAAFIDSQPRPHKDQGKDWPDLTKKPIDFPFGPYADKFSEKQHKYGPFKPLKDAQKELTIKKS